MRLKNKLDEAKLSNTRTDEILLKSISNKVFRDIKSSIERYMGQIEIPLGVDKKEKKKLAFKMIVKNLSGMEGDIR